MHLSTNNLPEHEVMRLSCGEPFTADEVMRDYSEVLVIDGEEVNLRELKEEYQGNLEHAKDWTEAIYWTEKIIEVEGIANDNGWLV